MCEVSDEQLGKLVAARRKQRHMSQKDLADAVGRSASWVSQVERGVYPVDRVSVLQALADALEVPVAQLRDGLPDARPAPAATPKPPALTSLRRVLIGNTLGNYVPGEPATDIDLESADAELTDARLRMQAGQDEQGLDDALPALVQKLTATSDRADGRPAAALRARLVAAFQLIALRLSDRREYDAAWLAVEHSVRVAESTGQPAAPHAARHVMADLFVASNQISHAEYITEIAHGALRRDAHRGCGAHSTYFRVLDAALSAQRAEIMALHDDRAGAHKHLAAAQQGAENLPGELTVHGVVFGPRTAELCAMTVALHFGDAGQALDIAHTIRLEELTVQRQYEYWLATAHAHTLRRQTHDAVVALRRCEQLRPGEPQRDPFARETLALLTVLLGRSAGRELTGLHPPGLRAGSSDPQPTALLISVRRARLLA